MNKKILYGLLAGIVLTIVLLTIKFKSWKKEFKFGIASGVRFTKIGLTNIQIHLPLWFYNPSPIQAVISNLDLKIFFNGTYISSIKSPANYLLASKRNSTYPLDISLSTGQILNWIAEHGYMIEVDNTDWLKKVDIVIIGNVTLDLGLVKMKNIPIKIEDNLKTYVG